MTDLNAKIIPLQTETPGLAPTEVQCDVGEIAVNLTDRKIFSKRSDGTVVTLAGGSKVQDAEDFDFNKKPGAGWRYEYTGTNESQPPAGEVWQFTAYTGNTLAFSTIDLDGENHESDLYALNAGDTVRLLDENGTLISQSTVGTNPLNKNDNRITITFEDGVTKPQPGSIVMLDLFLGERDDIPLQYGDAIVWSADSESGDAFRPRQFKIEKLLDVQLPDSVAGSGASPTENHWRWEIWTKAQNQCPSQPGLVGPGIDVGGASVNASPVDMDGKDAQWAFNNLSNGATYYWRGDGGEWQEDTAQPLNNISACNPTVYLLGLPGLKNWITNSGNVGDVVEVADRIPAELIIVRNERDVLQWDTTGQVYKHQALLFDITEAQDFAFTQVLPATPRWTNGDWLEDGEFTRTITQWIFNFVDANGNDRQAFFERWATATSVWSSPDGVAWTEYPFTQLEVKPVTSTCEITFEEPAPAADAPIFIAFSEPGIEINQPIIDGEVMVWDGSHWTPANPTASLALALNDLTDVNTITNPPADGQALVWDQTNGYWKPGTVASDSGGAETLDELTDVTLSTPLTGQVLTYSGAQWVNAKVNWTDLEDAPNVPQVIDDLGDVDTSTTAPTPGQVLTWDGTNWAPATSTGGGGARETVGGALTERADVTVTTDYTTGGTENIEFTGMGEAGSFVTVTATQPCWVRLYGTDTARTGDALRPIDEDPLAGSGVLLEVRIKNANEIITISPGAIYYNNDVLPEQTLYGRVTNESGGAAAIGVTIRAFTQTHTDAIVGGTFGSG